METTLDFETALAYARDAGYSQCLYCGELFRGDGACCAECAAAIAESECLA